MGLLNTDWNVDVGSNGDLYYLNMNATLTNNVTGTSFQLGLSYFMSAVVGSIDLGNTLITPRMVESVVRVNGYQYAAPGNYLTLDVAAAYNDQAFNTSTKGVVFSGSSLEMVYVKMANVCQITTSTNDRSGYSASVSVSEWDSSSAFALLVKSAVSSTSLGTFLSSRFDTAWGLSVASIDFPAGASDFIYDPTIGSGTTGTGAAVTLSVSSLLLALACLFAMLV